jgi:hypothetical protein
MFEQKHVGAACLHVDCIPPLLRLQLQSRCLQLP